MGRSEDKVATDTWLRIIAIGLPLVGALVIWRWGARSPRAQRWLVVLIFGTTGLIALSLFLLNRYYVCILASGRQSCLFDGSATLSLFLLSTVLARGSLVLRGEDRGQDYVPMLLLGGAWAGMALAQNLCLFLVFLNLFFLAVARWLRRKGLGGHFLMLRDDYRDDDSDGMK